MVRIFLTVIVLVSLAVFVNSVMKYNELRLEQEELEQTKNELMEEKESKLIADQDEVLRYLTSVLRGESQSTEIVVEGTGEGRSEARTMQKEPSEKDRLKAAELLGKRYGIYTESVDVNGAIPVVVSGDDQLAD